MTSPTELVTEPIPSKILSPFSKIPILIVNYGLLEPQIPPPPSPIAPKNSSIKSIPLPCTSKPPKTGGTMPNTLPYFYHNFRLTIKKIFLSLASPSNPKTINSKITLEAFSGNFDSNSGSGPSKFFHVLKKIITGFPTDFTPFTPGLEIKYAIE